MHTQRYGFLGTHGTTLRHKHRPRSCIHTVTYTNTRVCTLTHSRTQLFYTQSHSQTDTHAETQTLPWTRPAPRYSSTAYLHTLGGTYEPENRNVKTHTHSHAQ